MKRQRRVRPLSALCALACVVSAGVLAQGASGARAGSSSWHASLALAGYGFGDCCTYTTAFSDHVTIPAIGNAVVSGEEDYCGTYLDEPLCPPDRDGTTFSMRFSTPAGDLDLAGFAPRGTLAPYSWAVVGGTGRFARAAGSGTYTLSIDTGSLKVLVTLDGAVSFGGSGGPTAR